METSIMNEEKLKMLNQKRISLFALYVIMITASAAIMFVTIYYVYTVFQIHNRIIRYAFIPVIYFVYYYLKKKRDSFNSLFNEFIIEDAIRSTYPDWIYADYNKIDGELIYESNLVRKGSSIDITNNIIGTIGNTKFDFSEIKITKNQTVQARLPSILFHGYYFIFDNNKNIDTRLWVKPKIFRDFGAVDFKEPMIKTDAAEFDKRFSTFTFDPLKARYILTPALMARMLDFEAKYKNMASYLFYEGKLYIAFKGSKLEAALHKSITMELINKQMEVFKLIGAIVEELNLDTRIWTKPEGEI